MEDGVCSPDNIGTRKLYSAPCGQQISFSRELPCVRHYTSEVIFDQALDSDQLGIAKCTFRVYFSESEGVKIILMELTIREASDSHISRLTLTKLKIEARSMG